jgi:hypothetical protein
MSSRDGFLHGGGSNSRSMHGVGSPDGVVRPTDRAAAAYEEVFFQSANSNEARLRLLEVRPGACTAVESSVTPIARDSAPVWCTQP